MLDPVFSFDYIRILSSVNSFDLAVSLLHSLGLDLPSPSLTLGTYSLPNKRYSNHYISPNFYTIAWGNGILLNLPGQFCRLFSLEVLIDFLSKLLNSNFYLTRVDLTCDLPYNDDYSPLSLSLLCPDYLRYARTWEYSGPRFKKSIQGWCEERGSILRLGDRESSKFLRVYDARPQHSIDAVRFECEVKKSQSKDVVADLIKSVNISSLIDLLFSSVDFCDDRFRRLPAWDKVLRLAKVSGSYRPSVSPVRPSLSRTKQWLSKQVSSSLAMCKLAMGDDHFDRFYQTLLDDGFDKLGPRHKAIASQYLDSLDL